MTTDFKKKYGKTINELSDELQISLPTLSKWANNGDDIFFMAKELNAFVGNKKLAKTWRNMQQRCINQNSKGYKYYGGKGIKISMTKQELVKLWQRDKASQLNQPSIDRRDSNKDYSFDNCRFIEFSENRSRANKGKMRKSKSNMTLEQAKKILFKNL